MKIKGDKLGVDYLLFMFFIFLILDQIRNQELPSTNRPGSSTQSTEVGFFFKFKVIQNR